MDRFEFFLKHFTINGKKPNVRQYQKETANRLATLKEQAEKEGKGILILKKRTDFK